MKETYKITMVARTAPFSRIDVSLYKYFKDSKDPLGWEDH